MGWKNQILLRIKIFSLYLELPFFKLVILDSVFFESLFLDLIFFESVLLVSAFLYGRVAQPKYHGGSSFFKGQIL